MGKTPSTAQRSPVHHVCACVLWLDERRLCASQTPHVRDRARRCLFVRLTQTDCRGAVLCRVHYLIRVNFSNNPLLARVAHRGGGGAESLITFLLHRRSVFSITPGSHLQHLLLLTQQRRLSKWAETGK